MQFVVLELARQLAAALKDEETPMEQTLFNSMNFIVISVIIVAILALLFWGVVALTRRIRCGRGASDRGDLAARDTP